MRYGIIKMQKQELIRQSVATFDWEKAFSSASVNEKVAIFNRTILNVFHKPFFDKKTLFLMIKSFWFNDKVRLLLKKKR